MRFRTHRRVRLKALVDRDNPGGIPLSAPESLGQPPIGKHLLAKYELTRDNAAMTVKQKNAAITLLWLMLAWLIIAGDYLLNRHEQPTQGTETATPATREAVRPTVTSQGTSQSSGDSLKAEVDLSRMVYVPAGQTANGLSGGQPSESQAAFFIDRQPVTVSEYVIFLNQLGRPSWDCSGYDCLETYRMVENVQTGMTFEAGQFEVEPGFADRLVTGIDQRTAQIYCHWTGKRLPTPVEWQQAIRNFASVESGPDLGWRLGWDLRCVFSPPN